MNQFKATIEEIETEGSMSLVKLSVGPQSFSSIILENPESAEYLFKGNEVDVMFKETEVVIDINPTHSMSLRNRIEGKIDTVEKNQLLTKVHIKTKIGSVTSIITTDSCDRLNLKVGDSVFAMIKTNEIFLSA